MTEQSRRSGPGGSRERITTPSLSLPSGGGAIRGLGESFQSQSFTGGASFSIPIPAPPIRGSAPALNVSYSSGGGNGVLGLGFAVALSSIARKTSNGIPTYADSDVFILAEEGELVPARTFDAGRGAWVADQREVTSGGVVFDVLAYRPRREGSFARIERWTSRADCHWQVRTRDNVVHFYGRSAEARICDPQHPERIFQWLIDETDDPHGNKIRYHYKAENSDNVPAADLTRDHQTNRYPCRIEYGNTGAGDNERFAIQVVFDYGEFSLDDPDAAPGPWALRPDPFSSYRSGFEIRTLRRCRNILIYHCFADQFGGAPFLTRALAFDYAQAAVAPPAPPLIPGLSLLSQVTEIGFRKQDDGSYLRKPLPALVFSYSGFDPRGQQYQQLKVGAHGSLPGYLTPGHYRLVDLEGEGIPGILYSDRATTLQWEPEGNGQYSGPRTPARFPLEKGPDGSQLAITSLAGNGEPDLLVRTPSRSGFYRYAGAGAWDAFRSFSSVPADLASPAAEMVDMNGDGRADLVTLEKGRIRSYPSRGLQGFGPPDEVAAAPDFPLTEQAGAEEVLTFADLLGDGLSHRVRIRNGSVECWPNLGYGRFGAKLVLGNAPRFDARLDAKRLFLVDLDGSGPADLVYVSPDHIQVYFNQSGNQFSDALTIPLPARYDNLSQISFADVNGNGTSCLVLTRLSPEATHHFYDFAGDLKPYLLTGIDNQLGAATSIQYSTSVRQYLEDKRAGWIWSTRLFFPVHVVARLEHSDRISGLRHVTRYKYHDGYYDPDERQFRGFGLIEAWDTDEYEEFKAAIKAADFSIHDLGPELYVPPVYTRTWYHIGAPTNGAAARSGGQYWNGDPAARVLPETLFAPEIHADGAETVRQAHAALAGQMLRQEVYGLDNSALAANPYTVSEERAKVRLLQARAEQPYAVFVVEPLEQLSHEYDRNPADPRVAHAFTLSVDDYGNVQRSCSIAYPRRANAGTVPEQAQLLAVATADGFINHPDSDAEPWRWIGVPCESKAYELGGLKPAAGYFSLEEVGPQVDAAFGHPLAYHQAFTPGACEARLTSWSRSYFWNDAQSDVLPLNQIAAPRLLHHAEAAVATPELMQTAFAGKGDAAALAAQAGYNLDQGYWWNRDLVQYYFNAARFFLPCQTDGAFAGVDRESAANPTTVTAYDAYDVLAVKTTQYLSGMPAAPGGEAGGAAVVLTVTAENDYRTLGPWRITDANGNITEALYDPLGMVVATARYGTQDGQPAGDAPLKTYQLQPGATFQDVVDNPAKYLQQATSFFFYDVAAWAERGQPAASIGLQRQLHVHALSQGAESPIEIAVAYSGGLGHIIEEKRKVDPQNWAVTGRTVYNNKGKPTEQYLPYFSGTPAYEDQRLLAREDVPPPTVLHYDALGRSIRTDTPKGFFSKVEFSPWAVKTYDENDTVIDSQFYKNFPADPQTPADKNERDALDKAAAFYNTPAVAIMDCLGRTVRARADNLGMVDADALKDAVGGSASAAQQLFDSLVAGGYLEKDAKTPTAAWVTEKLQPYDPDFQQAFKLQFGDLAAPTLALLKESGLVTLQVLDITGRTVRTIDPRLLYTNVTGGSDFASFANLYDMAGNVLAAQSADAGARWTLTDFLGKPIAAWDSRNFHVTRQFDRLGRAVSVQVVGGDGTDGLNMFADPVVPETIVYGESQANAAQRNLNGRVYQNYDPAGLVTNTSYGLAGAVTASTRQVRPDYQKEANWTAQAISAIAGEPAFASRFTYDALGRVVQEVTPDQTVTTRRLNLAGQVVGTQAALKGAGANDPVVDQTIVDTITYDAKGQRTTLRLGNGVVTNYSYEDTTLRLINLHTTRAVGEATEVLQDITCTYDPAGNITRKEDSSWQTVFCYNQQIDPVSDYTCDALYRLVRASGRQQPGIARSPGGESPSFIAFCPAPEDQTKLENYVETYSHDDGGNLLAIRHAASTSWTKTMDVAPGSNRLASATYDGNGNIAGLDHLRTLAWNYRDNIARADVIVREGDVSDAEFYLYDAGGARILKVAERVKKAGGNGATVSEIEETIYLGNYQVKRIKQRAGADVRTILQRETLSATDDKSRVCLIQNWTQDDLHREVDAPGVRRFRYQLDDHQGSVALEVDVTGQRISYEEYLPYGGTAFVAAGSAIEAALKEYRYSGKEQDAMTGLYYYGARYYPPWMGRWLNPDPAGAKGGANLYAFVGGNPVSRVEADGRIWGTLASVGATLLTGGGLAYYGGLAKGTTSGIITGALSGAVGAVVGAAVAGTLALAAAPVLATAATGAAIGVAGSVVGGYLSSKAMEAVDAFGPRPLLTTVVGTAVAITAAVATTAMTGVPPTSALASRAAAIGGSLITSGSYIGLKKSEEITLNPATVQDTNQIKIPTPPANLRQPIRDVHKMLLVMAPQAQAEERQSKFDPVHKVFRLDLATAGTTYHTVAAHGVRGYIFVPVERGGEVTMQPIPIKEFAVYVRQQLAQFNLTQGRITIGDQPADNGEIKFISCFGGTKGLGVLAANAQILADVTGRTVHAFTGKHSEEHTGPWKKFKPRRKA